MLTDFDFERADALPQDDGPGARAYVARVAEEDGAALVGPCRAHPSRRVAVVRRMLLRFDRSISARSTPPPPSEVCAELEALIIGSQRLGNAAHALDIAAAMRNALGHLMSARPCPQRAKRHRRPRQRTRPTPPRWATIGNPIWIWKGKARAMRTRAILGRICRKARPLPLQPRCACRLCPPWLLCRKSP